VAVRIVCLSSNKACGCVGRVAGEPQRFFIVWLEERQGEIAVSQETEADYRREFLNIWLGWTFWKVGRWVSDERIARFLARDPLAQRWRFRPPRLIKLRRYPPELCAYPGCSDEVDSRGYCVKHGPDTSTE
jgi:hypothetical protein